MIAFPAVRSVRSRIYLALAVATLILACFGTVRAAAAGTVDEVAADAAGPADQDSGLRKSKPAKAKEQQQGEILQEVTVTGTYIRGTAPIGSPLIVYSREAIAQSGAATIGDFARQIPENFSGADALTAGLGRATQLSTFDQSGDNIYGGTAFNLNGMGPSATLTLLNGQRLAPAGGDGSSVDVSLIPLSAVERIEILPDGASAIYGSDAVAGVVNIITRKDFNGAQTSVSYGEATGGGAGEVTGSQVLGKSWSSGNAMMTYEYYRQSGLDASQRDFIPDQGGPDSILPPNWRNSVLISGNQDIGSSTSLSGEAIYSSKRFHSVFTVLPTGESDFYDERDRSTQSGVSMTVHQALAGNWALDITGFYSRIQQAGTDLLDFAYTSGFAINATSVIDTNTSVGGADLLAQGTIVQLPGGDLKGAVGGSFERQSFTQTTSTTGSFNITRPEQDARRSVSSVYGELVVPIVGPSNRMAWAHSLEVSAAARADHYSDFGSAVTPKLGLVWSPIAGLNLRATYGKSYRAPLLSYLASPVLYSAELFPDPASASGFTDTLYVVGGNPNLQAEHSRSFSVGPDVEVGGLSAAVTYFHTRYVDRVGSPPVADLSTVLVDPVDAPFVMRNPSPAVVDAAFNSAGFQGDYVGLGPSGVTAIFNSQYANLATTTQSSVDLRVAYREATAFGTWSPSIAVNRLIQNDLQASPGSPSVALLDIYGQPVRWKLHGGLTWSQGGYGATVSLNHVSAYHDQFATPPSAISSWTTADLHFSYRVPETVSAGVLRGITMALTVENVTDEKPPYVAFPLAVTGGAPPIPYDPANASPVGRFVSLQVDKRWAQ
jgi:iron complex outermembrane recepter protein